MAFNFDSFSVRSWLVHGMVAFSNPAPSTSSAVKKVNIKRRGASTVKLFIAATAVVSMHTVGPRLLDLRSPTAAIHTFAPDSSEMAKADLIKSLDAVASLGCDWQGHESPAASSQAIIAAKYLIPELPKIATPGIAGVDGDGNIYLKWQQGEKLAYLTIEPSVLHLLVIRPQGNLYIDDMRFRPRNLPAKVFQMLEQEMVG